MGRRAKYTSEHDTEMKSLYEEELLSLSKLSQRFGMPPEIIKRKLKKQGVAIRGQSEAMKVFHQERGKNGDQSES